MLLPLVGFAIICAFPVLKRIEAADSDTVAALRAAFVQWRTTATLRSTYVLREGHAASLKKAFSANPFDSITTTSSGKYCKMGQLERYSRVYSTAPYVTRMRNAKGEDVSVKEQRDRVGVPLGGKANIKLLPLDEAINGDIYVSYHPGWKDFGEIANVARFESIRADQVGRRCTLTSMFVSPLHPASGCYPGLPIEPAGGIADSAFSVEKVDASHLKIKAKTPRERDGQEEAMSIEWWTEPSIPVITRIVRITKSTDRLLREEAQVSDFTKCDGLVIGRHVVLAAGTEQTGYEVFDWVSTDLGNSPPAREDFSIAIKDDTIVGGLKKIPPRGSNRSIAIADLQLTDLVAPTDPPTKVRANTTRTPPFDGSSSLMTLIIAINAFIIGIMVVVIVRGRLGRKKEKNNQ